MMKSVLIEPHYFGNLEYYALITRSETLTLDIHHHFVKQTYRNRCAILTPAGRANLSVPVSFSSAMPFKDVKIDHAQSWRRDHWGAISSAYGKAPFFEYFSDAIASVYEKKHTFLLDLSVEALTVCLKLMGVQKSLNFSKIYLEEPTGELFDARNHIHPKPIGSYRPIYQPVPYFQNFGKDFVPNLSILDLLFCEGNQALDLLTKSFKNN